MQLVLLALWVWLLAVAAAMSMQQMRLQCSSMAQHLLGDLCQAISSRSSSQGRLSLHRLLLP
jgi:hypothetical protein